MAFDIRKIPIKKTTLFRLLRYWPPYLGAGIRLTHVASDLRSIEVEMKAHPWNRNYVGVHFGGSLYAMTDPFYMLMLMENLGPQYIVWDKSAQIRFKRPGKGRVKASFELTAEHLQLIREEADSQEKSEPQFQVRVFNDQGEVVAEVDKVISVRRKDKPRPPRSSPAADS